MSVELVGLAYDQHKANAIWSENTILQSYHLILDDEFRRKVDYRSMLYHKGQLDLLLELEVLLRQGGQNLSIVDLQAAKFSSGVDETVNETTYLSLDYQLIRYFASLAMVDDFLVADPFLKELLKKIGFLSDTKAWSLLEVRDFGGLSEALREVRMQDIIEASQKISLISGAFSLENLVRNYIEFLGYTRNNGLTPFFYNSQSALKQWGNLVERQNQRSEMVVVAAMRSVKKNKAAIKKVEPGKKKQPQKLNLAERIKLRRERDALIGGLSDPDLLIRQKAAESLGRLGDPEILPFLIEKLSEPEPEIRQEVLRAMAKISAPGTSGIVDEYLLKVLADDDSLSVRLVAAYLLQKRQVKQSIPVLIDLVEQMQPHFATILAYHPLLSKDAQAQKRLLKMCQSSHPEIRRDAAFILGRMPLKVSEDPLSYLIQNDADETVKNHALYSMWDLRSKKLKKLIQHTSRESSEKIQQTSHVLSSWISK